MKMNRLASIFDWRSSHQASMLMEPSIWPAKFQDSRQASKETPPGNGITPNYEIE